ncbi:MAG: PAS domain-containing protein [Leptolyngbyaceae cyanobacterium]
MHPDDFARVEAAIAHTLETEELLSEEYRLIWPTQSLHWAISQGRLAEKYWHWSIDREKDC